jgi:hypothetical protein
MAVTRRTHVRAAQDTNRTRSISPLFPARDVPYSIPAFSEDYRNNPAINRLALHQQSNTGACGEIGLRYVFPQ